MAMAHRLTQKFLALVTIKAVIVGYTQWAGALIEPSTPAVTMHPSDLGDQVRLGQPTRLRSPNPPSGQW